VQLPVDVVSMIYNFPAIIHRIESNLIALDACRMLGLNIRPDLALEAFTKDSDNTGEHDAEQVNFQGGMGNNYERLEFLGDSFLKMATTIAIFTLIPDKDEFEYHVERMLLICNLNLFNNALEVKLEEYIRSMAFDRRSWYPEGLTLKKGKRKEPIRKHELADKSIADVCEALIGAAYLTAQEQDWTNFDLAVRAVSTMVRDKRYTMTCFSDYAASYTPPAWQTAPCNSAQLDMAERFRQRLGYSFRYPRLLRSAFQHPTYPSIYEKLPSYQRLEFLGDSLLDMACVEYLFHRFPGADPQWLTEHKMAMVSNQFLGCLAVHLGFHRSLAYCSPHIQRQITDYVAEFDEALAPYRDGDGEGTLKPDFPRDFWTALSHPPKCLPDVVEAYLGAVFVDSGFDYAGAVRSFFNAHVRPWFEDMRLYDAFAQNHPVTLLGGVMQTKFCCRDWRVLVREMPPPNNQLAAVAGLMDPQGSGTGQGGQVVCAVRVHGQTVAHAVSASSRYGKISAAKKALALLEGMEVDQFRRAYGCACVLEAGGNGALSRGEEEGEHGSAI
jgi:endoribonuclease Dicer